MTTDTTERGLETLIMRHMTGTDGLAFPEGDVAETDEPFGGTGWIAGKPGDYDRAWALDPILDACVATYRQNLDENGQVDLKGKAKAFRRWLTDTVFEMTYEQRPAG